ncbi:venom metalloproteinase antarease-like TtrivMP_A [Dermacentor silvarum]|uniref:venom metalloproteinase antarease-like TtrivMP_A n=1 Tax=Dermacentor silvarum TaxID=543639 RepID=UPI0018971C79|nr:venom metalloproteinase antarease-like TtrivMP_A [Dermacentor silvarum]
MKYSRVHVTFLFLVMSGAAAGVQGKRLVYPHLLEEREVDGAKLVRVHEDLILNLRKVSVAASTLAVHEHENGKPTVRFYRGDDIDGNLYEDERQLATVMVTQTNNGLELEGIVGPRHKISPAPAMERSDDGSVAHMISEIKDEQSDMFDTLIPDSKDKATQLTERQYNYYQTVPTEVTVEVFVISDKIHQQRFAKTQHLLGYMCVMINSANLRFKDTSAPRIKLLLTGLERVLSARDEPYFKGNDKYMDDTATIVKLLDYVKVKRRQYGDPDVVYLATGRDMYGMDSGVPDTRRKGLAFVGGVCTDSLVGIGEDNPGSYDGMHALTHEVAHLLGAAHDGDPPQVNVVPGHPGALRCPFSQGYIMSYLNTGPNYHRFSPCSVTQMRYVMRLRGPTCWRLKSQGHKLDGYYPGMLVKPQDICKYKLAGQASVTADTSPAIVARCKVRCVYSKAQYGLFGRVYATREQLEFEAPDYASCGNGSVCIRGICGKK